MSDMKYYTPSFDDVVKSRKAITVAAGVSAHYVTGDVVTAATLPDDEKNKAEHARIQQCTGNK